MAAPADLYFDAAVFGSMILGLMAVAAGKRPGEPEESMSSARLAALIHSRTGLMVDPQAIDGVIDGTADCPVQLFIALGETLEPPGGVWDWFGMAFPPETVAHLHALRQHREVRSA